MLKICRITIPSHPTLRMSEVVDRGCAKAGIRVEDLWVGCYDTETHFGNWVLTPIRDNEAAAKLAAVWGPFRDVDSTDMRVDLHRFLLQPGDIDNLQVGDKVVVRYGLYNTTHNGEVEKKGARENGQQWVGICWEEVRGRSKRAEPVTNHQTFSAGEEVGIFLAEVDPSLLNKEVEQ
jgi:hypothetical protein